MFSLNQVVETSAVASPTSTLRRKDKKRVLGNGAAEEGENTMEKAMDKLGKLAM